MISIKVYTTLLLLMMSTGLFSCGKSFYDLTESDGLVSLGLQVSLQNQQGVMLTEAVSDSLYLIDARVTVQFCEGEEDKVTKEIAFQKNSGVFAKKLTVRKRDCTGEGYPKLTLDSVTLPDGDFVKTITIDSPQYLTDWGVVTLKFLASEGHQLKYTIAVSEVHTGNGKDLTHYVYDCSTSLPTADLEGTYLIDTLNENSGCGEVQTFHPSIEIIYEDALEYPCPSYSVTSNGNQQTIKLINADGDELDPLKNPLYDGAFSIQIKVGETWSEKEAFYDKKVVDLTTFFEGQSQVVYRLAFKPSFSPDRKMCESFVTFEHRNNFSPDFE